MIDIRQEIINKLDSLYPDIPIYGEEIPQGFEEPSFFIKILTGSQKKEVGRRYKRSITVDIHYFASSNKEAEIIANELYEKMGYLLNNAARGLDMRHEVSDSILHFFIDYKMHLLKQKEIHPKMNTLEVRMYGKGS